MIPILLACVLAQHPLAISGDETGFWFVGDRPLHVTSSHHQLCKRVTTETYSVLQSLEHRPIAIAVDGQTLWFVDDSAGISLYRRLLPTMKNRVTTRASKQQALSFRGFYETELRPTDLVVLNGDPVVACGGSVLSLFAYVGGAWQTLPALEAPNAQLALLQGQLIAASPQPNGIAMWYLQDGQWHGGEVTQLEGVLVDLITRDDWPIIVLSRGDMMRIIGLQHGEPIEITSFKKPKGRWGLTPSMAGLSAVGVERIGVTTVIDIGWPSGNLGEPIVLEEQFGESNMFFTTITLVFPLVLLFVMLKMRSRNQQKSTK